MKNFKYGMWYINKLTNIKGYILKWCSEMLIAQLTQKKKSNAYAKGNANYFCRHSVYKFCYNTYVFH